MFRDGVQILWLFALRGQRGDLLVQFLGDDPAIVDRYAPNIGTEPAELVRSPHIHEIFSEDHIARVGERLDDQSVRLTRTVGQHNFVGANGETTITGQFRRRVLTKLLRPQLVRVVRHFPGGFPAVRIDGGPERLDQPVHGQCLGRGVCDREVVLCVFHGTQGGVGGILGKESVVTEAASHCCCHLFENLGRGNAAVSLCLLGG